MKYEVEKLDPDDDDGTMVTNVEEFAGHVVGHRIVKAENRMVVDPDSSWRGDQDAFVITLDNDQEVMLFDTDDCCAFTTLTGFLLDPEAVNHVIMGVGTTEEYSVWHIYADYGDILKLEVGWSGGNLGYYGYGFDIRVKNVPPDMAARLRLAIEKAQS